LGRRRQRHLQQQPAQRTVAASGAHRPQPRGHHRGWCPQHPRRGPDSLSTGRRPGGLWQGD